MNSHIIASIASNSRVLSGSWLKLLAIATMTADHAALFILRYCDGFRESIFEIAKVQISWFVLLRCVGRMAFPLFAFLVIEGFLHTRSRLRYGRNLLLFALLSIIPWNLVHTGRWYICPSLNVLFTLLMGFLALCCIARWETQRLSSGALAVQLFILILSAAILRVDYGACGVTFIMALYILRQHRVLQAAIGFGLLPSKWIALIAFIPMNLYNGRRGFIQGTVSKYAFYAYYPLHLLVLYFLRCRVMIA